MVPTGPFKEVCPIPAIYTLNTKRKTCSCIKQPLHASNTRLNPVTDTHSTTPLHFRILLQFFSPVYTPTNTRESHSVTWNCSSLETGNFKLQSCLRTPTQHLLSCNSIPVTEIYKSPFFSTYQHLRCHFLSYAACISNTIP